MGLFGDKREKGFGDYVADAKERGVTIVDVREAKEYVQFHIPGAVNVPLSSLEQIASVVPEKDAELFVHCLGGGRSGKAVKQLAAMGYTNAINIGGIGGYRGETVRG